MSKEVADQNPESTGKPPDQPWFIPTDKEQGVFRFIIAASRRARQLQAGARPTISTTSRKPTKIGMEEIRSGEIAVEFLSVEEYDKNLREKKEAAAEKE